MPNHLPFVTAYVYLYYNIDDISRESSIPILWNQSISPFDTFWADYLNSRIKLFNTETPRSGQDENRPATLLTFIRVNTV